MKQKTLFSICLLFAALCLCAANRATAQMVASDTTGTCTWTLIGPSDSLTLTISGTGAMGNYNMIHPWYAYRYNIKTLDIQQGVTSIGNDAFSECIGLTSVTVPNSVTTIGKWAFWVCRGLTSVTIGNSVTFIGMLAFSGCIGLTEMYVKADNPPSVDNSAFNSVSNTIPVYVPCDSVAAYQNASGWSIFSNITGNIPWAISLQSNNSIMGSVSRIQTDCTNNTAIIAATANTGYCFVQWNDADTNNPRTVTVTQDTAFTAIFDVETGIADIEASIISLYPNPATDNINIVLPENVPSALFMLCDMQGRILLLREIGNREEITVTAAAGVYLYNIVTNRQNFRGKLIIGR